MSDFSLLLPLVCFVHNVEYLFYAGIPPHIDTHSAFEDGIISLSLGSQVKHVMPVWLKHFT